MDLLQQKRSAIAVSGEISYSRVRVVTPNRQNWDIDVRSDSATISLPLIYWPGWTAEYSKWVKSDAISDWTQVTLSPSSGSGWATVTLPQGEYVLRLHLQGTPLQKSAEFVSLLALVITCGVLVLLVRIARPRRDQVVRICITLVGGVVVVVTVAWLTTQFAPLTTPAMQTVDIENRQFPHRFPCHYHDPAAFLRYAV